MSDFYRNVALLMTAIFVLASLFALAAFVAARKDDAVLTIAFGAPACFFTAIFFGMVGGLVNGSGEGR